MRSARPAPRSGCGPAPPFRLPTSSPRSGRPRRRACPLSRKRSPLRDSMLIGIDHVVLATENPDDAAATLEQTLGVSATGGGRHDASGTMNRLVWLGDSYLELI